MIKSQIFNTETEWIWNQQRWGQFHIISLEVEYNTSLPSAHGSYFYTAKIARIKLWYKRKEHEDVAAHAIRLFVYYKTKQKTRPGSEELELLLSRGCWIKLYNGWLLFLRKQQNRLSWPFCEGGIKDIWKRKMTIWYKHTDYELVTNYTKMASYLLTEDQ